MFLMYGNPQLHWQLSRGTAEGATQRRQRDMRRQLQRMDPAAVQLLDSATFKAHRCCEAWWALDASSLELFSAFGLQD